MIKRSHCVFRSSEVDNCSGLMIHRTALDTTSGLMDLDFSARRYLEMPEAGDRATRWTVARGMMVLC